MSEIPELKLADDLFVPLIDGHKLVTIRKGVKAIGPGPMRFVSVSGCLEPITVEVYMTVIKLVTDLTDEEAVMDGSPDAEQMFLRLKRFYPDLKATDTVSIIAFYPPFPRVREERMAA